MRKDFCEFLLDSFPLLREYGNVSYRFPDVSNDVSSNTSLEMISTENQKRKELPKVVGTILYIDMPD